MLKYSDLAICSTDSFEYPDPAQCLEHPQASPYFAQRPYLWPSSNLVCTSHSSQTSDDQSSEDNLGELDFDKGKKQLRPCHKLMAI